MDFVLHLHDSKRDRLGAEEGPITRVPLSSLAIISLTLQETAPALLMHMHTYSCYAPMQTCTYL